MRNQILYYSIFILFGVSNSVNAQRLYELTPYSFYQEWLLIEKESHGNLRVYKPKNKSQSAKSNNSTSILKFKRRNHVLYSKSFKPIQKRTPPVKSEKPLNWSNAPKKKPIIRHRCGNEIIRDKDNFVGYKLMPRYKKKGVWSVYMENDIRFLVLEHKVSKNGKVYMLDKKEEFQIVSLKEDRMVLRKVYDEAESF